MTTENGRRPQLGSLEWTRANNGLLTSRREGAELLLQGIRHQLNEAPGRIGERFGRRRRPRANADLTKIPMPRTKAGRMAEAMIDERFEPVWIYHSYRTYLFGWIIGRYDKLPFDEEVLYVASLVHDLSLADSNVAVHQRCFTLTAAEILDDIAARSGWSPERRELACDAMTRHINLWIAQREAPEAYLLHIGSKLDVVGFRYSDISPRLMADILDRYPRAAFKSVFRPKMRAHAGAVPDSRAGWYGRRINSDKRRARSPFSE